MTTQTLTAYEQNMKDAHEALVRAKYTLNAARQQTDNSAVAARLNRLFTDAEYAVQDIAALRFGY